MDENELDELGNPIPEVPKRKLLQLTKYDSDTDRLREAVRLQKGRKAQYEPIEIEIAESIITLIDSQTSKRGDTTQNVILPVSAVAPKRKEFLPPLNLREVFVANANGRIGRVRRIMQEHFHRKDCDIAKYEAQWSDAERKGIYAVFGFRTTSSVKV